MHAIDKSVLVPHSARTMFELVDRVEQYPQFIPWCAGAAVLASNPEGKVARLDIDYRSVKTHFTTDNTNVPYELIVITLKDGPFRHLHGEWRFRALAEDACKVELQMAYEFASKVLETVVGPMFSHIGNTFIDAFVRRANDVYGDRL